MDYSYLIGLLVLVLIFAFAKKGNNSLNSPMTTLVLTKFQMMESDDSDELLYISGRQSGLIGWLLVKLGLGAETTIQVNKKELLIKSSSLSGEFHSIMTLKNIASSHCGFYKPIFILILAILFIIGGIFLMIGSSVGFGIFLIILGLICCAVYYFKKMIRIMVQTKGGGIFGMCFTPSFIEGINVDIEKARAAVDLINKYMLTEQQK